MIGFYILQDKQPVPLADEDVLKWGEFMNNPANKRVAYDTCNNVSVSTVFLGLDHSFGINDPTPILFETMVFGGPHDQEMNRCATWEEAEKMHAEFCALYLNTSKKEVIHVCPKNNSRH